MARVLWLTMLLTGAVGTAAGLLAPIHPPADFLNHFRPFIAAGAGILLAAALMLRASRTISGGAAVLTGLNAALLALPLSWSAVPAERPSVGRHRPAPRASSRAITTRWIWLVPS